MACLLYIYSDYRANLELVVAELLEMLALPEIHIDSDYMSDSEGAMAAIECNGKIALMVRNRLAPAIQHLIQHGLMVVKCNFKNSSIIKPYFIFFFLRKRLGRFFQKIINIFPTLWSL